MQGCEGADDGKDQVEMTSSAGLFWEAESTNGRVRRGTRGIDFSWTGCLRLWLESLVASIDANDRTESSPVGGRTSASTWRHGWLAGGRLSRLYLNVFPTNFNSTCLRPRYSGRTSLGNLDTLVPKIQSLGECKTAEHYCTSPR